MTLHLRRGVKFHSGREFNSSDVKATVEFASGDNLASLQAMYQTIKEVATPDPYTAVLKFEKVQPGIFDMLDGLYIIDKETIDQRSKMAVGTCPFKMSQVHAQRQRRDAGVQRLLGAREAVHREVHRAPDPGPERHGDQPGIGRGRRCLERQLSRSGSPATRGSS